MSVEEGFNRQNRVQQLSGEAEPTIHGYLIRSALVAFPLAVASIALTGAEKFASSVAVARVHTGRLRGSLLHIAQELGDGAEDDQPAVATDGVRHLAPRHSVEQPISYQRRRG